MAIQVSAPPPWAAIPATDLHLAGAGPQLRLGEGSGGGDRGDLLHGTEEDGDVEAEGLAQSPLDRLGPEVPVNTRLPAAW